MFTFQTGPPGPDMSSLLLAAFSGWPLVDALAHVGARSPTCCLTSLLQVISSYISKLQAIVPVATIDLSPMRLRASKHA